MAYARPHCCLLLICLLAASTHAAPKPASREDITFTENSWKEFISKDHDPAWTNGTDELTAAGCGMLVPSLRMQR